MAWPASALPVFRTPDESVLALAIGGSNWTGRTCGAAGVGSAGAAAGVGPGGAVVGAGCAGTGAGGTIFGGIPSLAAACWVKSSGQFLFLKKAGRRVRSCAALSAIAVFRADPWTLASGYNAAAFVIDSCWAATNSFCALALASPWLWARKHAEAKNSEKTSVDTMTFMTKIS